MERNGQRDDWGVEYDVRPARVPALMAGQPEERPYGLRYRDADVPVGEYSDIFVMTAGV